MIRALSATDIPTLVRVQAEGPAASQWSSADYEQMLRAGTRGWLSCDDGPGEDAYGFIFIRTAADELEILNIVVRTDHRRQGIAHALVNEALRWAKSSGIASAWLEVRESNLSAIAFYTAMGFRPAGRRSRYYHDPVEDALILTAPLRGHQLP